MPKSSKIWKVIVEVLCVIEMLINKTGWRQVGCFGVPASSCGLQPVWQSENRLFSLFGRWVFVKATEMTVWKHLQICPLMKSSRTILPRRPLSSATVSCLLDAFPLTDMWQRALQQHGAPEQLVIDLPDPTDSGKMLRQWKQDMHMVSSETLQGGVWNGAGATCGHTHEHLALQRLTMPQLAAFADNNFSSGSYWEDDEEN